MHEHVNGIFQSSLVLPYLHQLEGMKG